ncbi:MAG: anaerobic glycerol-3-phosphate dehydrogenase subunit C [Sedimentisphaerales bacterium]|nr:anaerobic glycerol-3-phosphate dehydrogenase subunit C [Sedimentisphaerales bacterium]
MQKSVSMDKDTKRDLSRVVRGDVYDDIIHRSAFATDSSIYQLVPACIVAPKDASDVCAVVKYARASKIPIVARGAGSGVAGESLTTGILFDMTRYMNRIVDIEENGNLAVCQPGVVLDELNARLAGFGRKIGPDPSTSNRATIGGCVANNATGSHSLMYGYIGDYVESIEAVLANGDMVRFENDFEADNNSPAALSDIVERCSDLLNENRGVIDKSLPRTKRNSSGYNIANIYHDGKIDIAKMLAGSEGTLCIFTEITLRTVEVPACKGLLEVKFKSTVKMAQAVPAIVDSGASACELMDRSLIQTARGAYLEYEDVLDDKPEATLFVEHIADNQNQLKEKLEQTKESVSTLAYESLIVLDSERQGRIEKARKDAVPLLNRAKGAKKPIPFIEDVSVDNTQLVKYISGLEVVAEEFGFEMSLYGHAGDGELHVRPYLDLSKPADIQKMKSIADDVFALAWSLGGTISGEHADGLVRATYLQKQYGPEFFDILRQIKEIFDPDNIMNPGKIINDDPNVMTANLRASYEVEPARMSGGLLINRDELREELEKCSGCGLCVSKDEKLRLCPVYRAVGEELASARAKSNVLRFFTSGQMDDKDFESAEFRKFLDLCINCKACMLECPSGVDVSKLIGAARAEYVKRKGLRSSEFALSNNRLLSKAGTTFAPLSNFMLNLAATKWVLEKTIGLDKRRTLPKFASKSFIKAGNKYLQSCPVVAEPISKVAYFVDSYANYNDHELGFAVLDVLIRNGVEVIIPKQRPAPLPAVCYGDRKKASRDLAFSVKHLAQAVRSGYKVLCSEPSAALCLKDEMKHFVWDDDAKLVSRNTVELMNFLLDLFKAGKIKPIEGEPKKEYLYHLPCHLCAVGNSRATIELMSKLCNAKLIDIEAGCCGIAGTFGMQKKNYELSIRIADNVKKTLAKSKIECLLTECSACKMQIEHISDKTVTHPIKIIADTYSQ